MQEWRAWSAYMPRLLPHLPASLEELDTQVASNVKLPSLPQLKMLRLRVVGTDARYTTYGLALTAPMHPKLEVQGKPDWMSLRVLGNRWEILVGDSSVQGLVRQSSSMQEVAKAASDQVQLALVMALDDKGRKMAKKWVQRWCQQQYGR